MSAGRICLLLCCLFVLPFLSASLPEEEVNALREIFDAANLQWEQGRDPCALPQVECHDGRTLRLHLIGRNITSLPESIGQLQFLKTLWLSGNKLSSLPKSVGQLQSLQELFLNNNQLTELPGSTLELSNLVTLDLDANQLTSLPASVIHLQSLDSLKLGFNQLVSLPETIGSLRSLSSLDLTDNKLTRLPDSLGQLVQLHALYVQSNHLTALPECLGQLRQLSALHLESNLLTQLPESLGGMHWLEHFDLDKNQLTSLPESLGDLEHLRTLRLALNKLTFLPESISKLRSLVDLNVRNNQLASLPDSVGNLSNLRFLTLDSNRLSALPESVGSLGLLSLSLDANRLTSIPHLSSPHLLVLRVAKNRLRNLPDLRGKTKLRVLSVHDNRLETLSQSSGGLKALNVVLLHSNRIHDSTEICRIGIVDLKVLYLHGNALRVIPPCLSQLKSLEVLTLHRNALTGEVPGRLFELPKLNVLTLHGNRLHGTLPPELATAPGLFFFSAHSNRLAGPIPSLNLHKDCVDDESFVRAGLTCSTFPLVESTLSHTPCRDSEVALHCPKTCKICGTASARGPVLLLHDNRLSCSLPEEVTNWPQDMRSISLVGNMLGNGTRELPQWIHSDEHQPFLYVSGNTANQIFRRMVLLASMCALCGLLLVLAEKDAYRQILVAKAGTDLTCEAHMFLLQMGVVLSVAAGFLLSAYYAGASYYMCGSIFASTTLSNFSDPYNSRALVEWPVSLLWAIWIAFGAFFLRCAPTPTVAEREETTTWWDWFLTFVYSSWSLVSSCCKHKLNQI